MYRLASPVNRRVGGFRGLSLSVRVLARDTEGSVMLVRHSYTPGWHFPGGGVELGETGEEAAARELAEEAGLHADGPLRLLGCFHNHLWRRGDHILFYEAPAWAPGPAHANGEIAEAVFHPLHRLPADLHPSVPARLAEMAGSGVSAFWEP